MPQLCRCLVAALLHAAEAAGRVLDCMGAAAAGRAAVVAALAAGLAMAAAAGGAAVATCAALAVLHIAAAVVVSAVLACQAAGVLSQLCEQSSKAGHASCACVTSALKAGVKALSIKWDSTRPRDFTEKGELGLDVLSQTVTIEPKACAAPTCRCVQAEAQRVLWGCCRGPEQKTSTAAREQQG